MERGLLLDVVVGKRATVLELFTREDEALLIWGDALPVLDLGFDIVYRVAGLDVQRDRLACQGFHEDLHATPKAEHQMERGLLLDVIVRKCATVLELLTSEDEALLIWGDALLVLDFGLDIVYRVAGLDVQRDRLACQGFHEDLHATPKAEHQMECGLLLDVVVRKRATVFELFTREDEALLIRWDALFILDFGFDVVYRVAGLNIQRDRLAREGFHEDLHAAPKAEHQMERGLFLDVVVRKRATVLQLLTCENEALLIWRDAFLIL